MSGRGMPITGRLIFGLVAITLGVLWTLDNLGLFDSDMILRWWPLALVGYGIVRLFGLDGCRQVGLGSIALLAGFWLLGEEFGYIHVSVWRMWPVALVILGLAMVSRAMGGRSMFRTGRDAAADTDERINIFAFWSGVERRPNSPNFIGGEVTAVMGGADINLRSAGTPPEGATLDLFVWMGGVEVTVPKDWRVINEVTAIMGAIEDQREAPSYDTTHTIRLRGVVVMGGVEIKG